MCNNECISERICKHNEECYDDLCFTSEQLKVVDKWLAENRNKTIDDCIAILLNIMPPEPYLLKSKHHENWKMKTTELRMLRDMFEQMKGVQND